MCLSPACCSGTSRCGFNTIFLLGSIFRKIFCLRRTTWTNGSLVYRIPIGKADSKADSAHPFLDSPPFDNELLRCYCCRSYRPRRDALRTRTRRMSLSSFALAFLSFQTANIILPLEVAVLINPSTVMLARYRDCLAKTKQILTKFGLTLPPVSSVTHLAGRSSSPPPANQKGPPSLDGLHSGKLGNVRVKFELIRVFDC